MSASRKRFVLNPPRYSQARRARSCFISPFLFFSQTVVEKVLEQIYVATIRQSTREPHVIKREQDITFDNYINIQHSVSFSKRISSTCKCTYIPKATSGNKLILQTVVEVLSFFFLVV